MRTLVPAETLVYLETNDLAAALQPIVDAKPFKEVAKSKPDFSALKGVQLAVAVTGFETSEEKLTEEHSVGRVQPHFVAVADTHAFNYQAVAFAEKKLGGFVADIYDSEPKLERSDKHGGKYFIWTAKDGRKAYALVIDSIIYFGNDESAIDKCLAVKRGESDSVAKAGKVKSADPATLASGYVSTDGVAQIANIVGLKFASEAGEDSEVQSAIAGILPQLIRNSVTNITWTSVNTEQGIEDKYQVGMPSEIANVLSETMVPGDRIQNTVIEQLPADLPSVSLYNFKDPRVAWRSTVLVAQQKTDSLAGKMIEEFSKILFDPYGIRDPELFLGSLGYKHQSSRIILTAKLAADSEESVVVGVRGDDQATIKSLSPDMKQTTKAPPPGDGLNVWTAEDGDLQLALDDDAIKIGSRDDLIKIHGSRLGGLENLRSDALRKLATSNAPITTIGRDTTTTLSLVDMLAREGHGETQSVSTYFTETRFTKSGMERKTTSDFGLIGAIIAQLAQD